MKKLVSLLVVFCLVASFAPMAMAQDENGPMPKLGRGFMNILDSICEIPGTMMRTNASDGAGAAFTTGLFEGIVNTVKRAAVGAYEVATFPIPVPADYEPILDEPQFLAVD